MVCVGHANATPITMNLTQQFADLFEPQQIAVATITAEYGSKWIGRTMGGETITLTGQASVGSRVYYKVQTRQIIEPAPNVATVEVPV